MPPFALACCAIATCLTGSASAALTSVDPFVGDAWESFEKIAGPGQVSPHINVFEGRATMHNNLINGEIIVWNWNNFPNNVEVTPHGGNYFVAAPVGMHIITFDSPVHAFGSWFSTGGPGFPATTPFMEGTISLYDASNSLVHTDTFDVEIGQWNWAGWNSDEAFSRVEVHLGYNPMGAPGEALFLDSMVMSYSVIPEPATAGLVGLAGLVLAARRRR